VTTVTRILIADDDPAIRNACRGILTRAGYVTQAAEDGLAALELVQAGDLPFHLVITDVVMPRMSGVALLDANALPGHAFFDQARACRVGFVARRVDSCDDFIGHAALEYAPAAKFASHGTVKTARRN